MQLSEVEFSEHYFILMSAKTSQSSCGMVCSAWENPVLYRTVAYVTALFITVLYGSYPRFEF